ncbi:MAG: hypothetical protein QF412_08070 [Planctomycetota bacterium]|jgi:hypothetical protein|nr:hypothetical protein [Planctomycetota bacterium]
MKAIRLALSSLTDALGRPGLILACWVTITIAALFAIFPVAMEVDRTLSSHPGANYGFDQALDADLIRLHTESLVDLKGPAIFVALALLFLSGGILSSLGKPRLTWREFGTACGRLFFPMFRAAIIGLLILTLWSWGAGAFRGWLFDTALRDNEPTMMGPIEWVSMFREGVDYLIGFGFLCVLLISKMAMAQLAGGARSAVLAWVRATLAAFANLSSTVIVVAVLTLSWIVGSFVIGKVTTMVLEAQQNPWLGLLIGQFGVVWTQVMMISFFAAARRMAPGHLREADTKPLIAPESIA